MTKQRIAIIGAGIVGATAAYQLSKRGVHVTIFDHGVGQATAAAAGIICPWLSQRRNKDWYRLVSAGAHYYPELMRQLQNDGVLHLPYQQVGTFIFKQRLDQIEKLYTLAQERKKDAEMIGDLKVYEASDIRQIIPNWANQQGALFASGGGRVDGASLTRQLLQLAQQNNATYIKANVTLLPCDNGRVAILQDGQRHTFDTMILATGAWLKTIMEPFNVTVDVRAQKGQLIECTIPYQTENWPVCMLHGEIDFIPFPNGRIVIGATHENDQGFDLTPDPVLLDRMYREATLSFPPLANNLYTKVRIGTRAYTSDFTPFFGAIPNLPTMYVASGLGSSGLTSGALIGQLLAQQVIGDEVSFNSEPFSPVRYLYS